MHILNYFFTPFGIVLILFAIFFSEPEKNITYSSIAVLIVQFLVNFYLSKNIYKFFRHMHQVRISLVIFNIATTSIIFYLLSAYWAPMWLLFVIPPAAGAMFMKKTGTFLSSFFSALAMLFIYYLRSLILEIETSSRLWAMASCHGLFIIAFSMFLNSMSEMMLKMRDTFNRKG
ncbi:MAG: hypothetical protein COT17_07615 [Elusimicrobia bacterium CG08_land_8_20_14_0_20_51_18]|nr:MAG: hypothetical protein COT17_07615 [Elusimicrobia bacterium CG08_land_8_20_14_0_20_51_18]